MDVVEPDLLFIVLHLCDLISTFVPFNVLKFCFLIL